MHHSLGYALHGLSDALRHEPNLQRFLLLLLVVICTGVALHFPMGHWMVLALSAGAFCSTELLNTAIERLSDVLDGERKLLGRHEYHEGIRLTKDIAASASLISLVVFVGLFSAMVIQHSILLGWLGLLLGFRNSFQ